MTGRSPHEVTRLLQNWGRGDQAALDELILWSMTSCHRLAHIYMVRERPGTPCSRAPWSMRPISPRRCPQHRMARSALTSSAISANVMRRILVEFGRAAAPEDAGAKSARWNSTKAGCHRRTRGRT